MELLERAANAIEPRPRVRTLDWCRENVFTHDGKPYDHSAYPHHGAPGGPFDAFDCLGYLAIWLQWASRLGKTFVFHCCLLKTAATRPAPMMFASSDQKLAVESTMRIVGMADLCPVFAGRMLPKHRRRQDLVVLPDSRMFVSWARSVSTLADKAVRIGHANEIDKWEHLSTSKEADPLKLFSDRFKEFPSHKKLFESTPAMKHSSRIERGRLASTNCSFWVPCPHCHRYQTLAMGDGSTPGGIVWEKNEAGKSDKDKARRTACYVCRHCEQPIRDEHRGPMMRSGVWIPEGCTANDEKAMEAAQQHRQPGAAPFTGWQSAAWITGTPLRDGRDAGYQLSSLYALSLGWGDIAAEFVDSKRNPQNLRNFINQWLAETWEVRESQMTWEQLGERLICPVKRYVVPLGYSLLTLGCDKQSDHIVYVLDAWGEGRRSHTVDYGTCATVQELEQNVLSRSYQTEDGKQLYIALTLMDSGYHPRDVYQFCREQARAGRKVWPCKGSSTSLGAPYKETLLGKDTLAPGAPIIHVDTLTTQDWINHQLTLDAKKDDTAATLFHGSLAEHEDFLCQLINEACVQKLTPQNITKEVWERIDENVPNDFRDCRRYAFAAMLRVTRGAELRTVPAVKRREERPEKKPSVQFIERPGGWLRR